MLPRSHMSGNFTLGLPAIKSPAEKHMVIVNIEARIVGSLTRFVSVAVITPVDIPVTTLTNNPTQGEPVPAKAIPPRRADNPNPPSAVKSGKRRIRNDRYRPMVTSENNKVISKVYSS